jgi:hypothetical protein
MNYFNPPVAMRSDKSGNSGALVIHNGKLAIYNKRTGPRVIAPGFTVIERQPVAGWFLKLLLGVWFQYATPSGDGFNSGGLSVLEDVEEALRCAGLIDEKGNTR